MAKDEIHRIEVIRLEDIFHLILEFISILTISLSDHLSLPRIGRLALMLQNPSERDPAGTPEKRCSGTSWMRSTRFPKRCWASPLVRSSITYSMSTNPLHKALEVSLPGLPNATGRLPKIRVIQDSFLLGFLQTFDMGIHCLRKLLPVTF